MLIKPFPHGKGSGNASIDYLIRLDYFCRKEKPPEVLRGDTEITRELINSIDREWKFTAGVCSWSGDDTVTSNDEIEVMDMFEELAFAGLEPDQYDILWVRHNHANHHELHFVIPRMELSTGKAFNAFPPGWEKDFGHLRDYLNIRHDWTRPNDPERKRMFTPNSADIIEARLTRWGQNLTREEKEKAKDVINEYLKIQIENGLIQNRGDIITSLREIGLDINRESKNFITVMDNESNQKIRLKRGIYESEWKLDRSSWSTTRENPNKATKDRETNAGYLADYERKLAEAVSRRARYNQQRYYREHNAHDRQDEVREPAPELVICESLDTLRTDRYSSSNRIMHRTMADSKLVSGDRKRQHQKTSRSGGLGSGTRRDVGETSQGDIRSNPLPRIWEEVYIHPPRSNSKKNDKCGWSGILQTGVLNHEQERTGKDSAGHPRTVSNRDSGNSNKSNSENRATRKAIECLRKGVDRFERLVQALNTTYKRSRNLIKKSPQVTNKRHNQNTQDMGR